MPLNFRTTEMIQSLNRLLETARMNTNLKNAVKEIRRAVLNGDTHRAAEVSGVKSFVTNEMDSKDPHLFQEDRAFNERIGNTAYDVLDAMNFQLSMMVGQIPAGMTVFTATGTGVGIQEHQQRGRASPTLMLMQKERARIRRGG